MVLCSYFHSCHALTQLDLLTLEISLEKIHSIWRIRFIKKWRFPKCSTMKAMAGGSIHDRVIEGSRLFSLLFCVYVWGECMVLRFCWYFLELMCLKIQHRSVSSAHNRSGRKQLPESQNWLLCGRDLVSGHRQVNSSFFAFYLKLNVGKVPTMHLLFEAFASQEQ